MKNVLVMLFLLSASITGSQSSGTAPPVTKTSVEPPVQFSLAVTPGVSIPLGADAAVYGVGAAASVLGECRFAAVPLLVLDAGLEYVLLPVVFQDSVSLLAAVAGAALEYEPLPWLGIRAGADAGYAFGFLNSFTGPSAGGLHASAGAGVRFTLGPSFLVGLRGGYTTFPGLYQGVFAALEAGYRFGKAGGRPASRPTLYKRGEFLDLGDIAFSRVFPVFFKFYDSHPIGKAMLLNRTSKPVTDISLTLFVKQYMDNPKSCRAPAALGAGERADVDLNALFTEKVLEITEDTKASAEIVVEFTLDGERHSDSYGQTIDVLHRNATTWDDDRRAAAFVTNKDPSVLVLSKLVAGVVKNAGSPAVNQSLRTAMALHEALSLYGLAYVADPTTPYAEFSEKQRAVDFLQFPRQTLQYRSGDCDDLSILYCALFESVGVETAFITIPGHIFAALRLKDLTAAEARRTFLRAEDLIFRGDAAWVPVEVTEIRGGFLKAWQDGAKEWREATAREAADFYPMSESWTVYAPVGLPGSGRDIDLPSIVQIEKDYLAELTGFIDREIYLQVAAIQADITRSGETPALLNRLGVLYARYGLYDRAEREFSKAVQKDSAYLQAAVNLGNIAFLRGDFKKAYSLFDAAYRKAPDNPGVLLGLARASHKLENFGIVQETYSRLKELSPEIARQYAYLEMRGEEATRAASVSAAMEMVRWED